MRVAVSGAGGRLGRALLAALAEAPFVEELLGWDLPDHDLDDPKSADRLVMRHRPDVVVHTAAWTDVDACALEPQLALRRNGTAVGEMAEACVRAGAALVTISTNEVFVGTRTDGRGYAPDDPTGPGNPYGAAKLAGEREARAAFGALGDDFARAAMDPRSHRRETPPLAIVRTAWLFGPPGNDFPARILAAAQAAASRGEPLKLAADEIGTPTFAPDLAAAVVALLAQAASADGTGLGGIHHVVNGGIASRAEWAREILRLAGVSVETQDVPMTAFPRASRPPSWGVLAPTPLPGGPLRDWRAALAEYMARPR
jgi:dTDP-4-dehydrorhamnose reductase